MSTGDVLQVPGLTAADVAASLAELAEARERVYYDAEADSAAADGYYGEVAPEQFGDLVTRTHVRKPAYKPAKELYPWVDLQPTGKLRSLYTSHEWDPEELIRADLAIAEARVRELTSRLGVPEARDPLEVLAEVEDALPFNCEHVVPQSWFTKKEPMRGDLHHLFACETRCNSFRSNTPYDEFADFPEATAADPALDVVRDDCGKSAANRFEPAHRKGAAARAVLYFLLRYPGVVEADEMPPVRQQVLVAWHEEEPVTEWERHRNAAIVERQGNRNPFIDRPELARRLVPLLAPRGGR
ncbi:endonuclease I family protein [Geodermatophilus sp. URMC 61]|uniref:endonuclease I family protein n=1 Tax=Geodermatophilus sp. URMC 61 TaxID=3423411 RepID=UPI00406D2CB1